MSGGKRYAYPKHVWASTGGWWPNPKNWRINTIGVAITVIGSGIFLKFFGPQIMQPQIPIEGRDVVRIALQAVYELS
ncbi:uncharacterized protein V1518DRAFT_412386 [Limtongia smithiae]|uniref:uncharacterized protein n=1 Tax=Limtongia smithiae TaxID=1125753 RepID=UPI0034CDEB28